MKLKTGSSSDLISEVRIVGHMPNILPRSLRWMPLDWRKMTISWIECRETVRRDGFWANARPESTPMISRQRIFSLNSEEMLAWVVWYSGCVWRVFGFAINRLLGCSIISAPGFGEEKDMEERHAIGAPSIMVVVVVVVSLPWTKGRSGIA